MILHDTASIVIERNGKFLLIKRANKPQKGAWAVPGGHVDKGETPKQAALREALEEIGCKVKIKKKLFTIVHEVGLGHCHRAHIFLAQIDGKPKAGTDAAKLDWFAPEQMARMDLTVYTINIFNKYLSKKVLDKISNKKI